MTAGAKNALLKMRLFFVSVVTHKIAGTYFGQPEAGPKGKIHGCIEQNPHVLTHALRFLRITFLPSQKIIILKRYFGNI